MAEGETVDVGTRIAVIDTGGGGAAAPAAPAPAADAPAAEAPAPPRPAPRRPPRRPRRPTSRRPASADAPHFQAMPVVDAPDRRARGGRGDANGESRDLRSFMSPVVARMVAEHGLDITQIAGTGRGGRVTKKDVEQHLGGGAPRSPPPRRRPPRPRPRQRPPLPRRP